MSSTFKGAIPLKVIEVYRAVILPPHFFKRVKADGGIADSRASNPAGCFGTFIMIKLR